MKDITGVYAIKNIENNKVYIGSTVNMRKRWSDPENKRKLSQALKKVLNTPEIAKRRSDGVKKRFSDSQERERHSLSCPHRKRVKCLQNNTIYESISEASRKLFISKRAIKNSLSGKVKCKTGYNFIRIED